MITIANANALHIPLADRSVQCVVTSPPYFGLRDYGTAKWEGGSAECKHSVGGQVNMTKDKGTNRDGIYSTGMRPGADAYTCRICGARRIDAQIGLEATPVAYVANIVAVMRECRRVLKDNGVLWLNIGDSYFGDSPTRKSSAESFSETWDKSQTRSRGGNRRSAARVDSLKPKDLCGIPWRVAFALQDDGWYLRQDIIWHKPNPMPESVTDRCTKAHEYIFLLTKQARYFFDNDAIREPPTGRTDPITSFGKPPDRNDNGRSYQLTGNIGANRRSVWTVATQPYSGSHFAVFPMALIEPMILAGSRRGDVILDPFAGSGTTGAVAVKHGRRAVLLDLNTKYIDLQFERTNGVQMTMPV